jgi:hypothetical protein
MENLFNINDRGATFSPCKNYRYSLWRIWDNSKPLVMFIGLNPSTANENDPDPTIKKVIKIAKHNGFGGLYMMNLFAFVTAYPDKLIRSNDLINDQGLIRISKICKKIVFAWGNFKVEPRDSQVKAMFPEAYALHINANGSPKHPLYCRDNSLLIPYEMEVA